MAVTKYLSRLAVKSLYDSERLWRRSEWQTAADTMTSRGIEENAQYADVMTRLFVIDAEYVIGVILRLHDLDLERLPLPTVTELVGNIAFLAVNINDKSRKKELEFIYFMLLDHLASIRARK